MADYAQNSVQAGDVLMIHVDDLGEIIDDNGYIRMTRTIETMAYLTLLGSNEDDDGTEATEKQQWWGNEDEPEERKYRGKFHHLISAGAPVTTGNISRFGEAALDDLEAAFVDTGIANSVNIDSLSLANPKRLTVSASIEMVQGYVIPLNLEVPL